MDNIIIINCGLFVVCNVYSGCRVSSKRNLFFLRQSAPVVDVVVVVVVVLVAVSVIVVVTLTTTSPLVKREIISRHIMMGVRNHQTVRCTSYYRKIKNDTYHRRDFIIQF
jgi:hypothetical protein